MDARAFCLNFVASGVHVQRMHVHYNIIMDTMHAGLSIRQKMALDLDYYIIQLMHPIIMVFVLIIA